MSITEDAENQTKSEELDELNKGKKSLENHVQGFEDQRSSSVKPFQKFHRSPIRFWVTVTV